MSINDEMERLQTYYSEKNNIWGSKRKGKLMIFYVSNPTEKASYKVTVDLEKFEEIERKELKRYYKEGEANRYR